ncbi:uncharacterized protein LOC135118711 [Helicoverpa armigera]|uniref:uncharacterized protein LOC135118711 n=1 Tax=Helicoverpa armigera TaxID=29058 RepID=UPI003083A31B
MSVHSGGEEPPPEPGEKRRRIHTSGGNADSHKYKMFTKPNYKRLFIENNNTEFTVYVQSTEDEKLGNKNPITLTNLITDQVKDVIGVHRINAHKIGITFRKAAAANNFLKMEDFLWIHKMKAFIPSNLTERVGVLRYVPKDLSNEEIYKSMVCDAEVVSIKRFMRKVEDGSKTDHNVRAAFYDPQLDFTKCIKLNAACSVFTAESYAIYCALQHAISVNNVHTILIVSDSKSVLSALNNVNMSFKLNYILYEIRVKTKQLLDKFINVEFVWVPSHSGITGNEIADAATHWEHYDDQTELVKVPFSDYHSHIKEINRKLWNDYWTLTLENKGKWYADIQKELRRKPWFNNCEYINRRFITTISRMRLGHCLTPAHLNRINVYNDSRCKYCDAEVADLDHIVLKCANFNIQRLILVTEICECEEIQQSVPRQVQELLANKKFYKTLYKYICNTVEKI